MERPDLRGVKRVKEETHQSSVNKALSEGWKLLDTYITQYGTPMRDETIRYVLVWDSEGEPPLEPPWGGAFAGIECGESDDGQQRQ